MVQFASSSMFFHEYPVNDIFDFVNEAGCTGIEFWIETPHFWIRGLHVGEVQRCITEYPELAPVTVHAPVLDLNPCSINPDIAAISVEYALRSVSIAALLNARIITVHPGRRTAKRTPSAADYERFDYFIDRLREASQETGVRIAIENMEPKVNSLLCTPSDMEELLDREPWLSYTLDVAHALSVSLAEVGEYLSRCGTERLSNVHLSAVASGKIHLPVSENDNIRRVLAMLSGNGYARNLTLEIEDRNFDHDLSSEEKIAMLARDVRYLQRNF
ncbi:MAG: sugar phosphate isomerase/epimerase [Methanomicrobiaceae archaeon]|nr:sugar phosphate isomerase/epimerase [Methanomicrobiaceae archaeon]